MSDSDIDELLDSDAENEKAAASDNTNLDTGQQANKNYKDEVVYFEVDGKREVFSVATGELLENFTTENEPESIGIDSADDIFSGEQPDGSNDDQPTSSSAKVTPKRRSSRRKSKDSVGESPVKGSQNTPKKETKNEKCSKERVKPSNKPRPISRRNRSKSDDSEIEVLQVFETHHNFARRDSTNSSRRRSSVDKPASNYDTDDDSIKFEYENIVTSYDQVDKDTYCLFCNKSLDSVDEFNRHVVDNHIWRRMEDDLERTGWQAGQENCPVCGQTDMQMPLHWGVHHGGIQRSLAKITGDGTHYVAMKSAEQGVTRYLRRSIAAPFVNIIKSAQAIEMSKPIKEESIRGSIEALDLDMEVTEDRDYDYLSHYNQSNQEDKVLFGAKTIEKSQEILSVDDDTTEEVDSISDSVIINDEPQDKIIIDSEKEKNEDGTGSNSDSSDSEADSENATQENKVEDKRVITKSLAGGILMSFIPHQETSNDENDSISDKEKPKFSPRKVDVKPIEPLNKVETETEKSADNTYTDCVIDTQESSQDITKNEVPTKLDNNSESFLKEPTENTSDIQVTLDKNTSNVDDSNSKIMQDVAKIKDPEAKHSSQVAKSDFDTSTKNYGVVNDTSKPKTTVKEVSSLDQQIDDIEKACNAFKVDNVDRNTENSLAVPENESDNDKLSSNTETIIAESSEENNEAKASIEEQMPNLEFDKKEPKNEKLEKQDTFESQSIEETSEHHEIFSNEQNEHTEQDYENSKDICESPEKENIEESIAEISNFINANPSTTTSKEPDHQVKAEPIKESPIKLSKTVPSRNNTLDEQKPIEIKSEPGTEIHPANTSIKQKSIFDLSTSNESLPEPLVTPQATAKPSQLSVAVEHQQPPTIAATSRTVQSVVELSSSKDDTDDEIEVLFEQKPTTVNDKNKSISPTDNKGSGSTFKSRMGKYHIPKKRPGSSSSQESDIQVEQPRRSVILKKEPALGDVKLLSRTSSDAKPLSTSPAKKEKCALCSQEFVSVEQLYLHLGREHFKDALWKRYRQQRSDSQPPDGGEWRCPNCKCFCVSDDIAFIDHYGTICAPHPVKSLYQEHMMKRKPDNSCVFCDQTIQPHLLLQHLKEKHIEQVQYDLGLVWCLRVAGRTERTCPLCNQIFDYASTSAMHHIMFQHKREFLNSLDRYKLAQRESSLVECIICQISFNSALECIDHLTLGHFKDDILSECLKNDSLYACSNCNYKHSNEHEMIKHVAIQHQRLNFYLTDRVLSLLTRKEVTLNKMDMRKVKIMEKDMTRFVLYSSNKSGVEKEVATKDFLLKNNSYNPVYKKCSKKIKKNFTNGEFSCPFQFCDMKFQNENMMFCHVAMRPHFLAIDFAKLEIVDRNRRLHCKLCSKQCMTTKDFESHLADVHFMDDILLETQPENNHNDTPGGGKFLCVGCPSIGYLTNVEMVVHRNKEHNVAQKFYERTQLTLRDLKCKLCNETMANLAQFKHHLGEKHFKGEINLATRIVGQNRICRICHQTICNVGGQQHRPGEHVQVEYDLARHVAVRHNYIEKVYEEELLNRQEGGFTAAASYSSSGSQTTFYCELCPPLPGSNLSGQFQDIDKFLIHLTEKHYGNAVYEQIKNITGISCQTCRRLFSPTELINHTGMTMYKGMHTFNCNQSMYWYLCQLHQLNKISALAPPSQSAKYYYDALMKRARELSMAAAPKRREVSLKYYPSTCLKQVNADFIEDPMSCPLIFDIDLHDNYVTVQFKNRLPLKSFKAPWNFDNFTGPLSCSLCPLYRDRWEPPPGNDREMKDAFLIHLANKHFKLELEKMFSSPGSREDYTCCSNSFNYQNLISHLKENHTLIQNMYRAVCAKEIVLPRDEGAPGPTERQYVGYLMPWLPGDPIEIKRTGSKTGTAFQCKVCNQRIPGASRELYSHYVSAHFLQDMERKFCHLLQTAPYRCDNQGCRFETQFREELLKHIGADHPAVVDRILATWTSSRHEATGLVSRYTPTVTVKEEKPAVNLKLSSNTFVSPSPFQCLQCHEVCNNIMSLCYHMSQTKHVNLSWAFQTNPLKKEDKQRKGYLGRWFMQLDLQLRCGQCVKTAKYGQSVPTFFNLPELFQHICYIHKDYFKEEYGRTITSFCICRICNSFLNLHPQDNDEDLIETNRRIELGHYLTHGHIFLLNMGIMQRNVDAFICTLCHSSFKSEDTYNNHLYASHIVQVINSFRDFDLENNLRKSANQETRRCCVCKEKDPSPNHLASHSKKLLQSMGLLQESYKDDKFSRTTCTACGYVDKDSFKVINHFAQCHDQLFKFVVMKVEELDYYSENEVWRERNVGAKTGGKVSTYGGQHTAVGSESLLKSSSNSMKHYACPPCNKSFEDNLSNLKKHLIKKHHYGEILDHVYDVVRHRNLCPECGTVDKAPEVHYWIKHIVETGKETVMKPGYDEKLRRFICELCGQPSKDNYSYYTHVFWNHKDQATIDTLKQTLQLEKQKHLYAFCPFKNCKTRNSSEQDLIMHYAIDHDYLETLLHSQNKINLLEMTGKFAQLSAPIIKSEPKEQQPQAKNDLRLPDKDQEFAGTNSMTRSSCPVCNESFGNKGKFDRSCHYLKHFRSEIANYVNYKFKRGLDNCCGIKFFDENTLYNHFGTQHNMFDRNIAKFQQRQNASSEGQGGHSGTVKSASSYSNEFEKYLLDKRPTLVASPPKAGEDKSSKRFQHYLQEFSKVLYLKYPYSFNGKVPLVCQKCQHTTAGVRGRLQEHQKSMLEHIARCKGELEELIQNSNSSSKHTTAPEIITIDTENHDKESTFPKVTDIIDSDGKCFVCGHSSSDLRTHYVNHFMSDLEIICKPILDESNLEEQITCPFNTCRVQIQRDCDLEDFLFKFFRHIGFSSHDMILKLFINQPELDLKPITEQQFLKSLSLCLWALKAGNCLVCQKDLTPSVPNKRVEHYRDHVKDFFKSHNLQSANCLISGCNVQIKDRKAYLNHLLYKHFNVTVKKHLKLNSKGNFCCLHCPTNHANLNYMTTHIINDEKVLMVELMASVFNGLKQEAEKEIIENDFRECAICSKIFQNSKFETHLYNAHFKELFQEHGKVFYGDFSPEDKEQPVCYVCNVSVDVSKKDFHLRTVHDTTMKLYKELLKRDSKSRFEDEDNNELTTLSGKTGDYAAIERNLTTSLLEMKQTNEVFVQSAPCYMFSGQIAPCHECKKIQMGANYAASGTCCCFEGFRKLRFIHSDKIIVAGYLDTKLDPRCSDILLWTPSSDIPDESPTIEEAFLILDKVADLLCEILVDEQRVKKVHQEMGWSVVWKRTHQGVREMCDVCSTSIFNLHFTCSTCGILVCVDCLRARKQGTKYKSITALTRQTQTKRRFKQGLDMNLWPLCMNSQIHDLDKLIMTQMSPGNVTDVLLQEIHDIRKYYQLEAKCICCHSDQQQDSIVHRGNLEILQQFDVSVLHPCPECGASLEQFSLELRKIHLISHIKPANVLSSNGNTCPDCKVDVCNARNMLIHRALCHDDINKYYKPTFDKLEQDIQSKTTLQVDSHKSCKICQVSFKEMGVTSLRQHYLNHVSALVYANTRAAPPFQCDECKYVEYTRNRLMLHRSIVHGHLDVALNSYITNTNVEANKAVKSWLDIALCVYCNEKLSDKAETGKRSHYCSHLRPQLEKNINAKYDKILNKNPPYRCREVGCNFIVEGNTATNKFIRHFAVTHKLVDPLIQEITRSMVSTENKEDMLDLFSTRCHICDHEFDQLESQDGFKAAKLHYNIHFKNSIEEKYKDLMDEHKMPLYCPFEGCQFNTEEIQTEQFGHHKRKLISHLGTFHDLFRKFITDTTTLSSRKYEASEKFLADSNCAVCLSELSTHRDAKMNHYYNHFNAELRKEFEKEIANASADDQLSCPFCDTKSKRANVDEGFKRILLHMGVEHGLFDRKIREYTRNLNYDKETRCRVCNADFKTGLAKATAIKKHYAAHFSKVMHQDIQGWNQGECPFCKQRLQSDEAMVIHMGTIHGYFCRYIEQTHWEHQVDEEGDVDLDERQNRQHVKRCYCLLCGISLEAPVPEGRPGGEQNLLQNLISTHLISHVKEACPGFSKLECTECSQIFSNEQEWINHIAQHPSYTNKLLQLFPQSAHKDVYSNEDTEINDDIYGKLNHLVHPHDEDFTQCYSGLLQDEESYRFLHTKVSKCPKCDAVFNNVDNLTVSLHLFRHYAGQLINMVKFGEDNFCEECGMTLASRQSFFLHSAIAHNQVNKFIPAESIQPVEAARTLKCDITRWTLPKNGKRYKTMCLICGSDDVRLASRDKVLLQADQTKCLEEGMGLHLIKHHLFHESNLDNTSTCTFCHHAPDNADALVEHIIQEHAANVTKWLINIFGLANESIKVRFSDFFIGLDTPGYIDFKTINIDKLVNPTKQETKEPPKVHKSVIEANTKRTSEQADLPNVTPKKMKKENVAKSVKCDVCLFHFSKETIYSHYVQHTFTELRDYLGSRDACPECHKVFNNHNHLIEHYGVAHKMSYEIFKTFDQSKINERDKEFKENLNAATPTECEFCGVTFVHNGRTLFNNMWMHYIESHKDIFTFVAEEICSRCNIRVKSHSPAMAQMAHHMLDHKQYLQDLISKYHATEWLSLGSSLCELCELTCPGSTKFTTAIQKRDHLLEHFKDALLKKLNVNQDGVYLCPLRKQCNFSSKDESLVVRHLAIDHKAVDHYLPKQLLLKTRKSLEPGLFCSICKQPECIKDIVNHLLNHFYTSYMFEKISFTRCDECNEECELVPNNPYGACLHHEGLKHPEQAIENFFEKNLISEMLGGSPIILYELKYKMAALLLGHYCIFCLDTIPEGETPANHLKQHVATDLNTALAATDDYYCDTCDGFPEFNSLDECVTHFMGDIHYPKSLASLFSQPDKPVLIQQKEKQTQKDSLLGKRKHSTEDLELCVKESCNISFGPSEYYSHYSNHFAPQIISVLSKQSKGLNTILNCPICDVKCAKFESLLEHYGHTHGIVDDLINLVDKEEDSSHVPSFLIQQDQCFVCCVSLVGNDLAGVLAPPGTQDGACALCTFMYASQLKFMKKLYLKSTYRKFEHQAQTSQLLPVKQSSNTSLLKDILEPDNQSSESESEDIIPSFKSMLASHKKEADKVSKPVVNKLECMNEPGLKSLSSRRILTQETTSLLEVRPAHSWLCDGRLLHLHDAICPDNLELFKQQWSRGQPVIIGKSDQYLNKRLWTPKAFMKDFKNSCADLVNTLTGRTVPNQPLEWFWRGFSSVTQRLVDSQGTPMLLKLKDWPPDGDIAEHLPKRYNDLINDFPIKSYTLREGNLNLASYMPNYFLKPELGPKMYIAYGNALYNERASTNLHLDMSDAVNLLVYVGLPDDCDPQENIRCVLDQIDEAGCDIIMRRRVREEGLLPGAIWHVFHPADTNKIRDFLLKVAVENGKKLDPHDDPIHDQSTYLDSRLRQRLYTEYGVHGYTIIQCAGDTVFIPAGACHQVRNLHNCIKIAEDFVSPELASNCLHLTQEFRHLTEHHTNHEDKLQIKNIIYHSVKTAVARLKKEIKGPNE